ncbi:Crp/Fnr family transcriptional regulator [Desulfitobacterium sp. AusDCA]|uniref:Crp/Fnr family transcriptional regulator n=1 Tax=Desulfitobacterium sp. AusDCA TaxID=3240383 RepID=UPI003DA777BC
MLKKEYLLGDETWKKLIDLGKLREYAAGEIIFLQDQPSQGLVCLQQGRIKTCIIFPNGTEKLLTILNAPCILGETPLIDNGMNTCSAFALNPTKITFIPSDLTQKFLSEHPELYMVIMRIMAKKMRWMHLQADEMLYSIPRRLAYLLLNYNNFGILPNQEMEERLIITHYDLGSMLGTTRQLITKYLNEFCKLELIEKRKGYIIIKDYEGLKRISDSDERN